MAGIDSLHRAKKQDRLLAFIPLLFSVQQAIEGLQWLVTKPSLASTMLGYGFLFFAFLLWPIYVPLTARMLERDDKRQSWLNLFVLAGIFASAFLFLVLILEPLSVMVFKNSIYYDISIPITALVGVIYVVIVAGSLIVCTDRWFKGFGFLLALSAIISWFTVHQTFTSVWCLFAAALSLLVVIYFRRSPQPAPQAIEHS